MGLAVLLGCLIKSILQSKNRKVLALFLVIYISFFVLFCQRTWHRNSLYNDTKLYYQTLSQSDSPYAFYGYQNLARLAIEKGAWEEAVVPLKTALSIEKHSDVTHNLLGIYYLHKNNIPEAVFHFKTAYSLSLQDFRYLLSAGISLMKVQKYEEAIEIFEMIQKQSPQFLSAYTNLISAYDLAGQPERSAEWANRGLEALKGRELDTVVILMARGRLAYRQGQMNLARESFSRIEQQYSHVFWYGDVVKILTGKVTANEYLEIVANRYPGFEDTAKTHILMSFVLNNKHENIKGFIDKNRESLDNQAKSQILIQREFEVALRLADE